MDEIELLVEETFKHFNHHFSEEENNDGELVFNYDSLRTSCRKNLVFFTMFKNRLLSLLSEPLFLKISVKITNRFLNHPKTIPA